MSRRDLTGHRFGLLTVVSFQEVKNENRYWLCKCECGNEKTVATRLLNAGHTKSCGCLKLALLKQRVTKHGKRHSATYGVWRNMRNRCYRKSDIRYASYGGRGIAVCNRWQDFRNFYADMGDKPNGKTLERNDNDKGYSPENCRWASRVEQANNTRRNVMLEHDGQKMTVKQWADKLNLNYKAIWARLNRYGWSVEKSLTTPIRSI